jgi:hypothetical protein
MEVFCQKTKTGKAVNLTMFTPFGIIKNEY